MAVKQGSWVQIEKVLLEPAERSERLPEETRRVPFRLRAKGILAEDCEQGGEATITTACGRRMTGLLVAENPAFTHSFGSQVTEFLGLGDSLRALWRKSDD